MKKLAILFLVVMFSLSSSLSLCRDTKKYTTEYNAHILETMSKEVYTFIASLQELEDDWTNKRNIITGIFDIVDKYNCEKKLYIVNRGLNIKISDSKISHLLLTMFIMNSLEFLDKIVINYDIASVKRGDPIKIQSDRKKT